MSNIEQNETCNGWANFETWNVALWISNDEGLNGLASNRWTRDYAGFRDYLKNECNINYTPDGVDYSDPVLDIEALDTLIQECIDDE